MAWYDNIVETTKGNVQGLVNALRNPQDIVKQGALYKNRDALAALLRGDTAPIMAKLNEKSPANPMEALDAAMMLGTINPVSKIFPKTEFELAHELAQQRAALPVSEGGLGLPENNTAMDRAKAMGFDTENRMYHGTQGDITAFDRNKIKDRFPQSFGIHTTSSPNEASIYADSDKNYLAEWNPNSKIAIPVEENANVIPLLARNTNQLKIQTDYPTASMEADLNTAEIIDKLWEKKKIGKPYESVKIDKIHQNPENSSWDGSNFIAMNPAVLRSPYAAFDPFKRNQADILAGVGALPFIDYSKDKNKK